MAENEYEGVDVAYANSEIRSLTLELMKLAAKQKKPFKTIVKEFVNNTYYLKRVLEEYNQ